MSDSTAARAAASNSPSAYAMRVSSEMVMGLHPPSPTALATLHVHARVGWSAYRWEHPAPPRLPGKATPRRARDSRLPPHLRATVPLPPARPPTPPPPPSLPPQTPPPPPHPQN